MDAKSKSQNSRTLQVSVLMDASLRQRLEAVARREIRSLAGEIVFRLQKSFEEERTSTTRRAARKPVITNTTPTAA